MSFIVDKETIIQKKPAKTVESLILAKGNEKSKNIKHDIAKKGNI